MASGRHLFTSESVSMGHPDKLADQISDGVLDALLAKDPMSRVACETMVTTGLVVIAGEITTKAYVDMQQVVREVIRDVGYTDSPMGISADHCAVMVAIDEQSPDIAMGVNDDAAKGKEIGAGDQGLMFGYACNDTRELMPLPISLAHQILNRLTEARFKRRSRLAAARQQEPGHRRVRRRDAGARRHGRRLDAARADVSRTRKFASYIIEEIVEPLLPADLVNGDIKYHINPTGRFVVGGPHGDCGLTGRKIIVDTYGGWGRHGGGAFSGKDPTKVDRSAAYMARYVAKNIVAAGLADRCEVQLAYAIGVSEPVSVNVDTEGTGRIDDARICELVREIFPLTPVGHHQAPRPAAADLSQDGRRRSLRPQRAGVHLGAHGQGEGASDCRGSNGRGSPLSRQEVLLFATDGTWREGFSRRATQRWPLRYLAAVSVLLAVSLGLFLFCATHWSGR